MGQEIILMLTQNKRINTVHLVWGKEQQQICCSFTLLNAVSTFMHLTKTW